MTISNFLPKVCDNDFASIRGDIKLIVAVVGPSKDGTCRQTARPGMIGRRAEGSKLALPPLVHEKVLAVTHCLISIKKAWQKAC